MASHNKETFVREYCRCRRIPYSIEREALIVGRGDDRRQVYFSHYNLTYADLINAIDEAVVYDQYGDFERVK